MRLHLVSRQTWEIPVAIVACCDANVCFGLAITNDGWSVPSHWADKHSMGRLLFVSIQAGKKIHIGQVPDTHTKYRSRIENTSISPKSVASAPRIPYSNRITGTLNTGPLTSCHQRTQLLECVSFKCIHSMCVCEIARVGKHTLLRKRAISFGSCDLNSGGKKPFSAVLRFVSLIFCVCFDTICCGAFDTKRKRK